MRALWTAMAAATGLGLSALAGSASAGTVVYNFTGDCSDCAGTGVGTLTLVNAPAGALSKADFLSFSYHSNLVSFEIKSTDIVAVMGSLDPNDLGKTYISIIQMDGTGWEFDRNADGTWSVSSAITWGQGSSKGGGGGGGGGGGAAAPADTDPGPGVEGVDYFMGADEELVRVNDDNGLTSNVVASVPEPQSWALMITGFAGMGALLRNRRRSLPSIETA